MATAFCSEPRFSVMGSFEDQINDRIQYLLCLHNSQVDVLNQHARSIDAIREEIRVLRLVSIEERDFEANLILSEVAKDYSEMQINSQLLRQRVNELEARIERMELEVADK